MSNFQVHLRVREHLLKKDLEQHPSQAHLAIVGSPRFMMGHYCLKVMEALVHNQQY